MSDKVNVTKEALQTIVDGLLDTIIKKNADYGDAWQANGIFTPLIRIKDKLTRLETLSDGRKAMVADEDIEETMRDTVAYGLLALLRLRWEYEQEVVHKVSDNLMDKFSKVSHWHAPVLFPELILRSLDDGQSQLLQDVRSYIIMRVLSGADTVKEEFNEPELAQRIRATVSDAPTLEDDAVLIQWYYDYYSSK